MPSTTPRIGLPYIEGVDLLNTIDETDESAAILLDNNMALFGQGTLDARPVSSPSVPGVSGRLWYATDQGSMYYDYGTGWLLVSQQLGDMKASARTQEHAGWIRTDGRVLTGGAWPQLRALLLADGSPHGVIGGDPKIPDTRGRVPMGAGQGTGLTDRPLGQQGGVESHALTIAQMPSHAHGGGVSGAGAHTHGLGVASTTQKGTSSTFNFVDPGFGPITNYSSSAAGAHGHAIGAEGGNGAHPNVQPYSAVQWFVYAGPAS